MYLLLKCIVFINCTGATASQYNIFTNKWIQFVVYNKHKDAIIIIWSSNVVNINYTFSFIVIPTLKLYIFCTLLCLQIIIKLNYQAQYRNCNNKKKLNHVLQNKYRCKKNNKVNLFSRCFKTKQLNNISAYLHYEIFESKILHQI